MPRVIASVMHIPGVIEIKNQVGIKTARMVMSGISIYLSVFECLIVPLLSIYNRRLTLINFTIAKVNYAI
jgi:hypothetical protein